MIYQQNINLVGVFILIYKKGLLLSTSIVYSITKPVFIIVCHFSTNLGPFLNILNIPIGKIYLCPVFVKKIAGMKMERNITNTGHEYLSLFFVSKDHPYKDNWTGAADCKQK
jgi:hypothetical protein